MADEAYFLHCILTMMGETLAEDGTGDGDQVDAYVWEGWGGGRGGGGRAGRLLNQAGGACGGAGRGGWGAKRGQQQQGCALADGECTAFAAVAASVPVVAFRRLHVLPFFCCCFGDRICCHPLPPPLRWLTKRRQQVEAGALEYVAHNLDYCAVVRRE